MSLREQEDTGRVRKEKEWKRCKYSTQAENTKEKYKRRKTGFKK